VFSVGSVPRDYKRAQSEEVTEYRGVVVESWVEFWGRQSKVIEKK
jgi:hypothetical protein